MFSNGPTVVTNGLVLALDAGDRNSYVSGSTTWFDLAGSNNGTLVNGPTFNTGSGGSIVFDRVNDYATVSYTQPAQDSTTSFTWALWIYLPSGNPNNHVIFGNRFGPVNLKFTKITPTYWENYPNAQLYYPIPTNQWINICVVKNQINYTYYANATQQASSTSTQTMPENAIYIGADAYSGVEEPTNVRVATALIYNRALSASEVLQNYNATKGRFGL